MPSCSGVDHYNNDYSSQPRGFLTPPPTWAAKRRSPAMPRSEKKPRRSPQSEAGLFHVIHKIPSGDSPYVRAKHVHLVDKDPSRAVSLFWAAINYGDRVDSALKDMAIVMKQLNRSDEAIEAIKSFRHLCPPESQESLDNILVELYKQSGRIGEEIEMLQLKLKQLEEGIAFGGKRIKMARSQGKKIQVTVEKEYSRLLGNLAWAYMQQRDFKSAEKNYRKALSFESEKNKQCNLAVCLMHMKKLNEAKFLLQAIRVSSDNCQMDESYAKSYERASQMLNELESQCVLEPMKQTEQNNESGTARGFADRDPSKMKPFGGQRDGRFCFQKCCDGNSGMQASSPLPLCLKKMNNGAFTEFLYEKRADFDQKKNPCQLKAYESPICKRIIPKVPFTQPQRCSWSRDQRKGRLTENACGIFCRKLSFESSMGTENVLSSVNQNVNEMPNIMTQTSEKHLPFPGGDWRNYLVDDLERNSGTVKSLETNEGRMNSLAYDLPSDSAFSADYTEIKEISDRCEHKKSWADIVEEDEQELESWRNNDFLVNYSGNTSQECLFSFQTPDEFSVCSMNQKWLNNENLDPNITSETPKSLNQAEKLSQKIELIDLGSGYFTQPEKTTLSMNQQSVRRSLCFDQNATKHHCTSPLTTNVSNFEGQGFTLPGDFSSTQSVKPRNRLQVFQDLTLAPESPIP